MNLEKIDDILLDLAKGTSLRRIEVIHKVDRVELSTFLTHSVEKTKITEAYLNKVCSDVLKRKLTYEQVKRLYKAKGLKALVLASRFKVKARVASKVVEILKLRKGPPVRSCLTIARLTGIDYVAVYNIIKRHYGEVKNHVFEESYADRDKAAKLFKQGYTPLEIAKKIFRSERWVREHLRKATLISRFTGLKLQKSDFSRVHKLRTEFGFTFSKIALIYNTTPKTVRSFYDNYKYIKGELLNEQTQSK